MPRVALNKCKDPTCTNHVSNNNNQFCDPCLETRRKARQWSEETFRERGYSEHLAIRFKRSGTKERLREMASKRNLTGIGELIEDWIWSRGT